MSSFEKLDRQVLEKTCATLRAENERLKQGNIRLWLCVHSGRRLANHVLGKVKAQAKTGDLVFARTLAYDFTQQERAALEGDG